MPRNIWQALGWVAAGILAAAGIIAIATGLATPVSAGWHAYMPLAGATYAPPSTGVVVTRATMVGFVLLMIGLVALAFLAGLRAGKAHRSS